jgi:DNA/RNA endonuclease G (NUC1)
MHKALNKGVWYTLENRERALAKEGNKVRVKVILSFSNESNTVDGGATIPSSFTKIIEYFKNSEKTDIKYEVTREVYIFPNDDSVKGTNLDSYKLKLASGKFLTY